MTLEELQTLWAKDGKIDKAAPQETALIIPQLYNKYFRLLAIESRELVRLNDQLLEVKKDANEYFFNPASTRDEDEQWAWTTYDKKPTKDEWAKVYMPASPIIRQLNLAMAEAKLKVTFLDDIRKMIKDMQFTANNLMTQIRHNDGV